MTHREEVRSIYEAKRASLERAVAFYTALYLRSLSTKLLIRRRA